jgi:hypothetical protein
MKKEEIFENVRNLFWYTKKHLILGKNKSSNGKNRMSFGAVVLVSMNNEECVHKQVKKLKTFHEIIECRRLMNVKGISNTFEQMTALFE